MHQENFIPWFTSLEEYRLDDMLLAKAYENTAKQLKQSLKTAIAYQALASESIQEQRIFQDFTKKGFRRQITLRPVPWLIIFCSENFISPAKIIAAAMPAHLAHVPIIFISEKPVHQNILVSLELLGLEDIYCINHEELLSIIKAHNNNCAQGRLVLLYDNKNNADMEKFTALKKSIQFNDYLSKLPIFIDNTAPKLVLDINLGQEAKDVINFAHGNAQYITIENCQTADAYYTHKPFNDFNIRQVWGKGMEACWHHINYGQDFFIQKFYHADLFF